jgi:class 3 adenylate cyclase
MDIRSWLEEQGLGAHADAFTENGVEAGLLPELSNDDLKDLGIHRLADHKRLLKAIEGLGDDGGADAIKPDIFDAPSAEGERRQLTIFFADLSGYTELTGDLDAEDLHRLMGLAFDRVDRIVEDHGGTEHRHVGDEVMALFGTPVAHTDDPMRAVRAAFEAHRAMLALGAEQERTLAVHIGIASGSVIAAGQGTENHEDVTGYAVTGAAANLAARLNSMAAPGETIISDNVYRAVEAEIDCGPLGETTVKGFAKPVLAWRAEALRVDGAKRRQSPLIGRRAEMAQFGGALKSVQETGDG